MPLWNNNDLENSKPSWLTEEQKRQCFRTIRGWEMPLAGNGFTNTAENILGLSSGATSNNSYLYRAPNFAGLSELLVAMPIDKSFAGSLTGVTNANAAGNWVNEARGATALYGVGNTSDLPNYVPYFTSPSAMVSGFTGTTVFAVKGITTYLTVIANDPNLTDLSRRFVYSLTTSDGSGLTGLSLKTSVTAGTWAFLYDSISATSNAVSLTGLTLAARQAIVFNQPTTVRGMTQAAQYWDPATKTSYVVSRYGGAGGFTSGLALIEVGAAAATGNYNLRLQVNDGTAKTSGQTGSLNFVLNITSGTSF